MAQHDCSEAVHYVDPPYVHSTRSLRTRSPAYKHEMTDQQHEQLASALTQLRGAVVVSSQRLPLPTLRRIVRWVAARRCGISCGWRARSRRVAVAVQHLPSGLSVRRGVAAAGLIRALPPSMRSLITPIIRFHNHCSWPSSVNRQYCRSC